MTFIYISLLGTTLANRVSLFEWRFLYKSFFSESLSSAKAHPQPGSERRSFAFKKWSSSAVADPEICSDLEGRNGLHFGHLPVVNPAAVRHEVHPGAESISLYRVYLAGMNSKLRSSAIATLG
ncbi:MAG TPA: hypothetical protein PKI15_09585 [Candidatus Cloacimonadota bacterium]|nr:hypothetical protein [Candidatus Cloacimonadota bacterium]